jgi:hypothetical protein
MDARRILPSGGILLGPANTCFAPAFFVRNPEKRDGIHPTHRYSPLAELALLRGSCLVPAEIRNHHGSWARNKC